MKGNGNGGSFEKAYNAICFIEMLMVIWIVNQNVIFKYVGILLNIIQDSESTIGCNTVVPKYTGYLVHHCIAFTNFSTYLFWLTVFRSAISNFFFWPTHFCSWIWDWLLLTLFDSPSLVYSLDVRSVFTWAIQLMRV